MVSHELFDKAISLPDEWNATIITLPDKTQVQVPGVLLRLNLTRRDTSFEVMKSTGTEIPKQRTMAVGEYISTRDIFYVFGGLTEDGPDDEMWGYDFTSSQWIRMENHEPLAPSSRFGMKSTLCFSGEDKAEFLVIYGGTDVLTNFTDIYSFYAVQNSWQFLGSLLDPLTFESDISCLNDTLLVGGGIDEDKIVRNNIFQIPISKPN